MNLKKLQYCQERKEIFDSNGNPDIDEPHRLYHAMNLPCPCEKVQKYKYLATGRMTTEEYSGDIQAFAFTRCCPPTFNFEDQKLLLNDSIHTAGRIKLFKDFLHKAGGQRRPTHFWTIEGMPHIIITERIYGWSRFL